jgi:hypothetical protein
MPTLWFAAVAASRRATVYCRLEPFTQDLRAVDGFQVLMIDSNTQALTRWVLTQYSFRPVIKAAASAGAASLCSGD